MARCRQSSRRGEVTGNPWGHSPLMRMAEGSFSTFAELRKADVETFSIIRPRRGRPRRLARGEARPVNEQEARRIKALAIPPAWTDVRISADPRSHIQAVGRDAAGRRQYIYHADWEKVRSAEKGRRLRKLICALPRIRRSIARDIAKPGNLQVLATVARLVDRLCLRAGHEEYAGEESGRGAATLLKKHVRLAGGSIDFDFPGKGKKRIVLALVDTAVARNIAKLRALPGRRLFKLKTERGYRDLTATDLNTYLADVAGCDISAKDFRTLRASSMALAALKMKPESSKTSRRKIVAQICRDISAGLCNTPAVVRKSYIHSPLLEAYERGDVLDHDAGAALKGCTKSEASLLSFLLTLDENQPILRDGELSAVSGS
jgi:DNA topoisomerase-1